LRDLGDNVLYHSLFESASPQWVLSAFFGPIGGHPREAVGLVNTSRLPVTNFPGERIGDLASTRIAQEFISPRRRQHKGEIEALPAAQAGEWAAEKASLPVWKNPTMVVSPLQTSAPPDRCDVVV